MTKRLFRSQMFLAATLGVIISLASVPTHIQAATLPATPARPAGIKVAPFLQEVTLNQGAVSTSFSVDVSNYTQVDQELSLSTVNFGTLNETGGVAFSGLTDDYTKKYGLADWLQLSDMQLNLKSNESKKIKVTVRDDGKLRPGGHYAAILVRQVANDSGGKQVDIQSTLSTLIFLTKKGGERYDLKLAGVNADSSRFQPPSKVTLHFSNPGNVYVTPRGTVQLLAPNGRVVSQGVINEDSGRLLPESQRVYPVQLRTLSHLDWLPRHYKLRVDYRYDGIEDRYARKEISVLLVNVPSLAIMLDGLLAIIVVIVVLFRSRRRWLRRPTRKANSEPDSTPKSGSNVRKINVE